MAFDCLKSRKLGRHQRIQRLGQRIRCHTNEVTIHLTLRGEPRRSPGGQNVRRWYAGELAGSVGGCSVVWDNIGGGQKVEMLDIMKIVGIIFVTKGGWRKCSTKMGNWRNVGWSSIQERKRKNEPKHAAGAVRVLSRKPHPPSEMGKRSCALANVKL